MTDKEYFFHTIDKIFDSAKELFEQSAAKHKDNDSIGFLHREKFETECARHIEEHYSEWVEENICEDDSGKHHLVHIVLRLCMLIHKDIIEGKFKLDE